MSESADHCAGHRERLRQKIISGNAQSLNTYELLECILFSAHARKDTKPIAKNLMSKFGSLRQVLDAQVAELKAVEWVGDSSVALIKCIKELLDRTLLEQIDNRPILSNWKAAVKYLAAKIGNERIENFMTLFLNQKNHLLGQEINPYGTIDKIPVYPREIIKKALILGASAIIVSHNHPSGDPMPSAADKSFTTKLQYACESTDIELIDHIIVTARVTAHFSFRGNGLM